MKQSMVLSVLAITACLIAPMSADALNLSRERVSHQPSPWLVAGEFGGALVGGAPFGMLAFQLVLLCYIFTILSGGL